MKCLYLLCAGALASTTLLAQNPENPERPPRRDPRAQERGIQRPERGSGLTEEQRKKLSEVMEKYREKQRAALGKTRELRQEIEGLTRAEKLDEAAIRAKAAELGQAEAEAAILRGKQFQELKGVLPADQLERFRSPGAGLQGPPGARYRQRLERVVPRGGRPIPPGRPPGGTSDRSEP